MLGRFLLLLALPGGLIGCTCGPGSQAPACETFDTAGAVFLGTVLDHNDNGSGKFTQWTVYLVRVDEAFRGLDPSQKEVFVDPGSFTSCYTDFEPNKQYLFVTGGPANFAAMSVTNGPRGGKPFPARWQSKKDLKVYYSPGCSPTRLASNAAEDLTWLRARVRGQTRTRVYGMAVQNDERFWGPPDAGSGVAGAEVTLSGAGRRFTTLSDAEGRYSFDGLSPGAYSVWAARDPWTPSPQLSLELRAGACALRDLNLKSQASVRGIVLNPDSTPASGIDVEIVRVRPRGAIAGTATNRTRTESNGRFLLDGLPAGEFVVGIHIGSAPTPEQPYSPTYVPGVQTAARAHRVTLEPRSEIAGLVLRLPVRIPTRQVQLRVFWADGSPVTHDARGFANYNGYRAAFASAKSGNLVDLVVLQGLDYTLEADWFSSSGEPVHYVTSEPVKLPAGRGRATVDIRLRPRFPR